jgi:hypothetical protein
MISQAADHAISAKLQRIGTVSSLFDSGLEQQASQRQNGDEASDSISQAITDLAEALKTRIAEDHLTPS